MNETVGDGVLIRRKGESFEKNMVVIECVMNVPKEFLRLFYACSVVFLCLFTMKINTITQYLLYCIQLT